MKNNMKKNVLLCTWLFLSALAGMACTDKQNRAVPVEVTMTKAKLFDKIKGGWAGQTIGCTYGGPTEFRYPGTMIQDYIPINWPDGYIKWYYENEPGLYDDVYMDLTFVDVFDRLGLDAPVDSFAVAFANAGYVLWHANQAARYNILNGIMPPESGHWKHNPHADDIDYQIEADYAGLMSPGMPNTASEISDKIGHIMNYGDGWYGGVYVGAMYTLAFVSDDIEYIVTEALKTIPQQSLYYQCINDVIQWYRQYPDDWKQTWLECEKKYSEDKACPEGIFVPFNIDATINSAYIGALPSGPAPRPASRTIPISSTISVWVLSASSRRRIPSPGPAGTATALPSRFPSERPTRRDLMQPITIPGLLPLLRHPPIQLLSIISPGL